MVLRQDLPKTLVPAAKQPTDEGGVCLKLCLAFRAVGVYQAWGSSASRVQTLPPPLEAPETAKKVVLVEGASSHGVESDRHTCGIMRVSFACIGRYLSTKRTSFSAISPCLKGFVGFGSRFRQPFPLRHVLVASTGGVLKNQVKPIRHS